MKTIYILYSFLLLSCMSIKPEDKMHNEVLDFLNEKKYRYSANKLDIPSAVIDSISRINNVPFKIGDSTNVGQISFSDARLLEGDGKDKYEYSRKLHFVLVSDTLCLIAYTEGGVGSHNIIDYIQYKGKYKHIRYITTEALNDTIKLGSFLRKNPTPVK